MLLWQQTHDTHSYYYLATAEPAFVCTRTDIFTKNYQSKLMYIEVIASQRSVFFGTPCRWMREKCCWCGVAGRSVVHVLSLWFPYILAGMLPQEEAVMLWFIFPLYLSNASALPGKTLKHKNRVFSLKCCILHLNASRSSRASNVVIIRNIYVFYTYKCKKLQFIHTVNGDGSKTAKIIKRQC